MFEIRKCLNPECGLRYPLIIGTRGGAHCPICRSDTTVILGDISQLEVPAAKAPPVGVPMEALLDNIRSAWNVGAMFRLADGAGLRRLHLCGVSATPNHREVAKTALGAEQAVAWEYHPDGVQAAEGLLRSGYHLWALEGGPRSEPLVEAAHEVQGPLVLAVGNEIGGVDPGIMDLCERVVYLPMQGTKKSLNVATAFGIAVYWLRFLSGD